MVVLSSSHTWFLALVAYGGIFLTTLSVATAQTIRGYGFTSLTRDQAYSTAYWTPAEACYLQEDDGLYTYELTITPGLYTEIQNALALGGEVRLFWQTQTILSTKGVARVIEHSRLLFNDIPVLTPRERHHRYEEDTHISVPVSYNLSADRVALLNGGGRFFVEAKAEAMAGIDQEDCTENITRASAEWKIYTPPRIELIYP